MTENLTDQDRADLKSMGIDPDAEQPQQRSLLVIWTELLKDVEKIAEEPITALVAHKVVSSWPKLSYQDTAIYHRRYHELVLEARDVLTDLVSDLEEGALERTGEDDVEGNAQAYLDLLVAWNLLLDEHEANWLAEDERSHIEIAALIDVRAFIFSDTGFAGQLAAIGFQLSNEEFFEALETARAAKESDESEEG